MATAGGGRGAGPERAFVSALPDEGLLTLDAEESAHLVRSRRARVGDAVVLVDGRGTSRLGRLERADARAAAVRVEGPYPDRRPQRAVRLAVALPEAGRADRMVSALAELGVAALAPLLTARTPPGRAEPGSSRRARWERLAREAGKVNGCSVFLQLRPALTLDDALTAGAILLDPDPTAPPLLHVLGDRVLGDRVLGDRVPGDAQETPWLLVGPEGGFDDMEVRRARDAGAPVARIGPLALRSETAAIAAAAIALCWPVAV